MQNKAAGEVLRPSRLLTGPGLAPAPGLRADGAGVFILSQTEKEFAMNRFRSLIGGSIVAVLLGALSPGIATAQSVRGQGEYPSGVDFISNSHISVDAWADRDGVVHGYIADTGGVAFGLRGGLSDPWFIEVVDLRIDGNTAYVVGVVTHSLFPNDVGTVLFFRFTDNSGTGEPDEISFDFGDVGLPIVAGNITVRD